MSAMDSLIKFIERLGNRIELLEDKVETLETRLGEVNEVIFEISRLTATHEENKS